MTPDSIKWREWDMEQYVSEACAIIRACIGRHSAEQTCAQYAMDDWEVTGAREGTLNPRKALAVLRRHNELAEADNGQV